MRKFVLHLLVFFIWNQSNSQTITINDDGCIGNNSETVTFSGIDGGTPSRNIYNGNFIINGDPFRVIWDNSDNRWEIQADAYGDGTFSFEVYGNSFASAPNPPVLNTGTWESLYFACIELTSFEGTGTQNVLPIELELFRGHANRENIELYWVTVTELNNKKFEIEHSLDGMVFEAVGIVEGKGTSFEKNEYSFIHQDVKENKLNYYRLKQIDLNGIFTYSDIIAVEMNSGDKSFTIYPNPTSFGKITLLFSTIENKTNTIYVFDTSMRLIESFEKNVSLNLGKIEFDLSELGSGMFFIGILQNQEMIYSKLIID